MDNEKIVRDLVNTFNDRDELHESYKEKMKGILLDFIVNYYVNYKDQKEGILVEDFIDLYVEERFRPEK